VQLMCWCWSHVKHGNEITATYVTIGKDLGGDSGKPRSRTRVCDMFRLIEQLNLLRREANCVRLNPHYHFRGTAAEQNRACAEWDAMYEIPEATDEPAYEPSREYSVDSTPAA
jgi:hypothetical protein